jgi:hypothetical protein
MLKEILLMHAMGLRDYAARGFAVGLAAHGIGTARAFVVDPVAGTFAGITMGLCAIVASLLIPVIARLLFPRLEPAKLHRRLLHRCRLIGRAALRQPLQIGACP